MKKKRGRKPKPRSNPSDTQTTPSTANLPMATPAPAYSSSLGSAHSALSSVEREGKGDSKPDNNRVSHEANVPFSSYGLSSTQGRGLADTTSQSNVAAIPPSSLSSHVVHQVRSPRLYTGTRRAQLQTKRVQSSSELVDRLTVPETSGESRLHVIRTSQAAAWKAILGNCSDPMHAVTLLSDFCRTSGFDVEPFSLSALLAVDTTRVIETRTQVRC